MKKLISGSFIACLILASSIAQATLIEISANPAVTPGIKAFVPNGSVSFPTPFYNSTAAPAPQTSFTMSDTIRVATQLDLTQITLSDLVGGHFGDDYLDWSYTFEALFNSALNFTGYVGYYKDNVFDAQTAGKTQVNFVSLESSYPGLFQQGQWKATSYLEGVEVSSTVFGIPEPGTLALLGMGLLMAGFKKRT